MMTHALVDEVIYNEKRNEVVLVKYLDSMASSIGALQDLRYGVRLLRRQPGFAAVAILTMALGISATTMLFSVAYGVLLKPLPWPEAERLVRVTETRQGRTGRVPGTVSNATFLAWREQPSTIEDLGGWRTLTSTLTGAGDPVRVPIISTTPSLFRDSESPSADRTAVPRRRRRAQASPELVILSYGLWQERFGGRPEIMGDVVRLDDRPHTIVGVMPREFAFPDREARAWTAWSIPPVAAPNGALAGVDLPRDRASARRRDAGASVR